MKLTKNYPKEPVVKKIKEAGWAIRLFGIVPISFGVILSLDHNYLALLISFPIAAILFWIGNKLYKENIAIRKARLYLRILAILLFPTVVGMVGLFVIWYIFGALSAISTFLDYSSTSQPKNT